MVNKWWHRAIFYEVYIASFCDGNSDGIGDFKGLYSKLDYLSSLGITGIWLTPFYPSPGIDNGYDISNYEAIDSKYGTMEDFENFLKAAHKKDIKVIVDLVINHTSIAHPWFMESQSSKDNLKRDWYIWRETPNNWESFFGGSAWEYDKNTQEYYYHSFAKEQADLNWANPQVKEAIFSMMDFWIEKGIDGFRLDVINNLSLTQNFKNNPDDDIGRQIHFYDINQEGIYDVLREIKSFLGKKNKELFTVGEISSDKLEIIESFAGEDLLDVTFNFNFGSISTFSPEKIIEMMREMASVYQKQRLPTLFFNSHDLSRSWNRLAKENMFTYLQLATIVLLNDGIPFLYQGEELGLSDFIPQRFEDIRDIQAINAYKLEEKLGVINSLDAANRVNRDRSRGMIPWEDTGNKKTWIGFSEKNDQEKDIFTFYQSLIEIRKNIHWQDSKEIRYKNNVLHYSLGNINIILNFNDEPYFESLIGDYEHLLTYGLIMSNSKGVQLGSKGIWIGRKNEY